MLYFRNANGLPAVSIDLRMTLGVGYIAKRNTTTETTRMAKVEETKSWGLIGIREEAFLNILSSAITGYVKGEAHIPTQIITGLSTGGMLQLNGETDNRPWIKDPKFKIINSIDWGASTAERMSPAAELHHILALVTSLSSAADVIYGIITACLARTIQIPMEDLDFSKPINAYEVESLVAVELRNWT